MPDPRGMVWRMETSTGLERSGTSARDVAPPVASRRLTAQLLVDRLPPRAGEGARVDAVVDVVGRLLAIQAQDIRGMRLAVRSRADGLTAVDVDRALARRRLVVTWLNRGTLHLVRAEDYPWLQALTAPRNEKGILRRIADEGIPPDDVERGADAVSTGLAGSGPMSRRQLRDVVEAAGLPDAARLLIHVLSVASLRGTLARGPMVGTEQAYVSPREWLGPTAGPGDRDRALEELAARYLAGHGPADERDLAAWTGLTVRDTRRAFTLAAGAGRVEPQAGDGRADLRGRATASAGSRDWGERLRQVAPRLLGPFDPVLHGWASRDWVTGGHQGIVTVNGIFRPVALVAGQAAGMWSTAAGQLELSPFAPLPPSVLDLLRADAKDVERFLAPYPRAAA